MTFALIVLAISLVILFVIISVVARSSRGLNRPFFKEKWDKISILAQSETTWMQALIEADKLLDEALKQSRFAGKSTADRMVSANRSFSNTDSVWRAHKLRNKVVHEVSFKLGKRQMVDAIKGYRQALKDLGAL